MTFFGIAKNVFRSLKFFFLKYYYGFQVTEKLYNNIFPQGVKPFEALELFKIAKKSRYNIIEIGAYCGSTTVLLADATGRGNKTTVHSIDPHEKIINGADGMSYTDSKLSFQLNIIKSNYFRLIVPHFQKSKNCAGLFKAGTIGLVFIDGDHSFAGAASDIRDYAPLIAEGGFIALHDYQGFDVKKAIDCELPISFVRRRIVDGLFISEKRSEVGKS